MVQKKYSVHKSSDEIQSDTVISPEIYKDPPRWKNPRTPQYIASATGILKVII